jgi:hypothetical protein
MTETAQDTTMAAYAACSCGCDGQHNERMEARGGGGREGGEDGCERVRDGALGGVVELGVAADRKEIGAETEIDRPRCEVNRV